jgi:hypothetical protein
VPYRPAVLFVVNPRQFGGASLHRVPQPVPELAGLFSGRRRAWRRRCATPTVPVLTAPAGVACRPAKFGERPRGNFPQPGNVGARRYRLPRALPDSRGVLYRCAHLPA